MRRRIIPYNPKLRERARQLRKNMPLAEVLLWKELRGRQMCGYDFDRQRPIDEYIVDFYSKDLRLAIEVDGRSHELNADNDRARQERLMSLGVRVLRFANTDVLADLPTVLSQIATWIAQHESD